MEKYPSYRALTRVVRARNGHSVAQAAKAAGISPQTWRRAERGEMPRWSSSLHKLSGYLGIDPADLLPGGRYGAPSEPQAATDAVVAGVPVEVNHG